MSASDLELQSGELLMGVGDGRGNLFVKGDYDSITVLQNKLLELENLRKENEELKETIYELESDVEEYKGQITLLRLELSQKDKDIKIGIRSKR